MTNLAPTQLADLSRRIDDNPTAAVEPIRLAGWFDGINDSVLALLFGQMVKRAGGIEHFHSDLYHDAHWLAHHITGPTTFYWAPRTWGSDIGTDRDLVATASDGKQVYRVDLICDDGLWSVTFTAEPLSGQ